MKWLAIFALLVGLQGQAHQSSVGESRIHFTFLDCPGDRDLAPRISVGNLAERREESGFQYNVKKTPLGFEGDVFLRPGFYDVVINVSDSCRDAMLVPVLRERDQNVLFIGFNGITLTESMVMIAGTAPFSGYKASIVYWPQEQDGHGPKTLVVDPAIVQGDSYYATGLGQGTVRLRISTLNGSNKVEFKIGKIGPGAKHYVTFNVSEEDVRNALAHHLSP